VKKYVNKIDGLYYVEEVFDRFNKKITAIIFDNECNLVNDANMYLHYIRCCNTNSFNSIILSARYICNLYNFLHVFRYRINYFDEQMLVQFIKYLKCLKIRNEIFDVYDFKRVRYSIENSLTTKVHIIENKKGCKIQSIKNKSGYSPDTIIRIVEKSLDYLLYLHDLNKYDFTSISRKYKSKDKKNDRRNLSRLFNAQGIVREKILYEPIQLDQILEKQEILEIKKHASKYESLLYFILENTGLRIGEALGLKLYNYNFENIKDIAGDIVFYKGRWKINVVYRPENENFRRCKSKSSRSINIKKDKNFEFEMLLERYILWRNKILKKKKIEWLFVNSRGTELNQNVAYKKLKETLKKTNIQSDRINKITLHVYRHTCASHLFYTGIPIEFIAKVLGHKNSEITEKIYIHIIEEMKIQENEKINENIEKLRGRSINVIEEGK